MLLHQIQDDLCGCDVVACERQGLGVADLRLQHDEHFSASKVLAPVPGLRQVCVFGCHVWVKLAQHLEVLTVFVQHDQVGVAPVL